MWTTRVGAALGDGLTLVGYTEATASSTLALDGAEASRDKWGSDRRLGPLLLL